MQAQASGQAGGGGGLQGALQNPKVQIGVIAVGALAIIVVIYLLFFSEPSLPAPVPGTATPINNSPGGGNSPGMPAAGGGNQPAMMTPVGSAPATAMAGAPGATGATGQAGATDKDKDTPKAPGVKTRANPFKENPDLLDVEKSIPSITTPPSIAPQLSIYVDELHKPKPSTKVATDSAQEGEPPIPAMRLAGVVYGEKVSATLQIGDAFVQAVPGAMVPPTNPLYHVDRIEQEKAYLSRRWELNGHKGVQHIEVTLAGAPPRAGGFAPGMPGGGPGGANGPGGGNGPGFFQ